MLVLVVGVGWSSSSSIVVVGRCCRVGYDGVWCVVVASSLYFVVCGCLSYGCHVANGNMAPAFGVKGETREGKECAYLHIVVSVSMTWHVNGPSGHATSFSLFAVDTAGARSAAWGGDVALARCCRRVLRAVDDGSGRWTKVVGGGGRERCGGAAAREGVVEDGGS